MSGPMIALAVVAGAALGAMVLAWIVARIRRDATLVDVVWSVGTGLAALGLLAAGTGSPQRRVILAVLIGAWSLRLSMHLIGTRLLGGRGEDGRYAAMRERKGAAFERWLLGFFLFQGAGVTLFAAPFAWLAAAARPFATVWDLAGIGLAVLALAGEAQADRQLEGWKRDPANHGRTCRAGWWRYSRHPNYFFEWLHWCAYGVIAIGTEAWWAGWIVPPVLLVLLFKVTGIPPTEARALASRGEDYRRYQRATSVFVPWWPKREEDPPS